MAQEPHRRLARSHPVAYQGAINSFNETSAIPQAHAPDSRRPEGPAPAKPSRPPRCVAASHVATRSGPDTGRRHPEPDERQAPCRHPSSPARAKHRHARSSPRRARGRPHPRMTGHKTRRAQASLPRTSFARKGVGVADSRASRERSPRGHPRAKEQAREDPPPHPRAPSARDGWPKPSRTALGVARRCLVNACSWELAPLGYLPPFIHPGGPNSSTLHASRAGGRYHATSRIQTGPPAPHQPLPPLPRSKARPSPCSSSRAILEPLLTTLMERFPELMRKPDVSDGVY